MVRTIKTTLQHCKDFLWRKLSPRVRRPLLLAAVVGIVIGATLLVSQTVADFSKPMGAPLPQFGPQSSTPAGEAVVSPIEGSEPAAAEGTENTPAAAPGSHLCGGPTEMILLLVGSDTRAGTYRQGLADTIRVVRLDFVDESISMLSVPRVLWVSSPALTNYAGRLDSYFGNALDPAGEIIEGSGAHTTLNTAYFYGNLYQLPPAGGPGVLAEALYTNLGIPAEHYVAVDMRVVKATVDAIGGLDIPVPYDVAEFSAGLQHMSGDEVLSFARTRESDNDWYRIERQDIVLRALWSKMAEPRYLAQIPSLIDRFLDDVLTDLSKAQVMSLACLMGRLSPEDIQTYRISQELVEVTSTTQGFFILLPKQEQIELLVAEFMGDG